MAKLRRSAVVLGSVALLLAAAVAVAPAPAAAAPSTLTLIIDSILEIDDTEDGFGEGECWGDYEFTVNFAGVETTSPEFSIDPGFGTGCITGWPAEIPIGFAVTRTVDTANIAVPLTIEVTDIDTFNDDTIDVNPAPGQQVLQFSVDPYLGTFALIGADGDPVPGVSFPGGVTAAQVQGNGDGDRGGLNLRIVASGASDADSDGLLDAWETLGYDADADGTVDVDLPAMGADPNHKDLFLELDTANGQTLGREDVEAMRNAFAAAPLGNPDGTTGVNLWVDTGGAVDPGAREGQALGSCSDGVDNNGDGTTDAADSDCVGVTGTASNYLDASVEDPGAPNCQNFLDDDGDGLADGADPDCVVGVNLGGGNAIGGGPAICNLNAAFFTAKAANFAPARLPIFRYTISTPGTAGCNSGGQSEIGGNDFVDHNGDGGTIMHELGHSLTLRHGGFEDANCKPNLVSVMSYFSQFGVGRKDGGTILDYSPPRQGVLSGPRSSALPASSLNEAALVETTPVDASDTVNRFIFTDGAGQSRWVPLDAATDWDGSGGAPSGTVAANIDTSDASTGGPASCTNNVATSVLTGANEWVQVSIPFRQFGDSASAAINPTEPHPTRDDVLELLAELTTGDLGVSATDAPDPVAAGTTLTVTSTITNTGPNSADATVVVLTADPRLTPTVVPAPCSVVGVEVRCGLGSLAPGGSTVIVVGYAVPADLVYLAGGPTPVAVQIAADHEGPDPVAANDLAATSTLVVAVADLAVDAVAVTDQPALLVLGEPATITFDAEVSNAGPSSPIDAAVTYTASGTGITSSPTTTTVTALDVGTPQTVAGTVEVTCTAPGLQDITLDASIAPTDAADTDPVAANDAGSVTITIDCAVPVHVDVEPGDPSDVLRTFSNGNAFVGVFTTDAGEYGLPIAFDATTILEPTIRLGTANAVQNGGGIAPRFADHKDLQELGANEKGKDGDRDQRLRFVRSEIPLGPSATEACVLGRFDDGTGPLTFYGCAPVTIDPGPS